MGQLRISKFTRPEKPKVIRLKDFHLDILDNIYQYRYLTAPQIAKLLERGEPAIKKHVRSLYDNRYVLRPLCQRDPAPWHTNYIYHSIGSKGAEVLRQEKGYTLPLNSYDQKEVQDSIKNWKHDTTLSDFMVNLKLHTRASTLTSEYHHVAWATAKGTIVPDRVVIFTDPSRPSEANKRLVLVEMDMGTEAIERFLKEGSSIKTKIEKYIEAYQGGKHTETYGVKNLRILFLTTSQQRIQSMIKTIESLGFDQRIFMFSTYREALEAPNLLTFPFLNNRNEIITLV